MEETERLQLKRVAKVLEQFSEKDRRAVLSAMSPVKRKFVESKLFGREEEEEEEVGMARKELSEKEELETMQQLVDMIERFK